MATMVENARGAATFSPEHREIHSFEDRGAAFFTREATDTEWDACIAELRRFRFYEEDWDGDGSLPPGPELTDAAISFAHWLQRNGNNAPDRVVVGGDGTIFFEWRSPAGYFELEICSPMEAEGRLVPYGSERAIVEHFRLGA